MARKGISVVEKHVEKVVVALFAAVLVWVITAFVVKSPNKIDLKGQAVDPGRIDEYVGGSAEQVWSRIRSASAEMVEIPDFHERQQQLALGPLHRTDLRLGPVLRAGVPFGCPVPEVQGPGARGQVTLGGLVAPEQPRAVAGRYSTYLPPGDSTPLCEQLSDKDWNLMILEKEQDVSWVTVAVPLRVEAQKKVFLENEYETSRLNVEATAVFLQRQRALPGGGWSDWEDVHTYKMHVMPPPPVMTLYPDEETGNPTISIDERRAFTVWLQDMRTCGDQLVRPQMPASEFGEQWAPPLCSELASSYPEEAFECPVVTTAEVGKRLNPRKQAELDVQMAGKLLEGDRIEDAKELVRKVTANSRLPRSIRQQAEQLESDILAREDELERQAILSGDEDDEDDLGIEEQQVDRRQEIYLAHDLTAESGGRYRYRSRIQALNPYAMVPDRLKNPEDAVQPFIEGQWSQPSEAVYVPLLRRVYLTKADPEDDKARFEVFIWTKGEWVKDGVMARVGERIGKKQKVQHYGLDEKIDVDFDTGLVVLDVLPQEERSYVPVEQTRVGGFEVKDPIPSSSVVCVAEDRRVVEFLEEADKDSEERRNILREIDAVKRSAKPRRRP